MTRGQKLLRMLLPSFWFAWNIGWSIWLFDGGTDYDRALFWLYGLLVGGSVGLLLWRFVSTYWWVLLVSDLEWMHRERPDLLMAVVDDHVYDVRLGPYDWSHEGSPGEVGSEARFSGVGGTAAVLDSPNGGVGGGQPGG